MGIVRRCRRTWIYDRRRFDPGPGAAPIALPSLRPCRGVLHRRQTWGYCIDFVHAVTRSLRFAGYVENVAEFRIACNLTARA